jgi:putative ABC transport system permease protein
MFLNYFKIAFRSLLKRKFYAAVNVLSLAMGIAGGIFMLVYVFDELGYDSFHVNRDRIFRVNSVFVDPEKGGKGYNETNAWPLGKVLEQEYPEIEEQVYMSSWPNLEINHNNDRFNQKLLYAETGFFKVFSFHLVKGNPATALAAPYQVVITEEMEKKFFPNSNALNQTLIMEDSIPMLVTGVVKDIPRQSHIEFDILVSFSTFEALNSPFDYEEGWGNFNLRNYLLVKEGVDQKGFSEKVENIYMVKAGDMFKSWGTNALVYIEPLSELYLNPDTGNSLGSKGNINRVYLVSTICLFTILLACINFINLATARSADRAKEVGLRKVVGSSRHALVGQFLVEAFIVTLFAFILGIVMAKLLMPWLNELLNKSYTLQMLSQTSVLIGLGVMLIVISLASGYYPALVLSGMQPIKVLKGKYFSTASGIQLRKGLVVFQFFIAVSLVLATFIVKGQLKFMTETNPGFAREEILVLRTSKASLTQIELLKQQLSFKSGVLGVTFTNGLPGRPGWMGQIAYPEGQEGEYPVSVEYLAVDEGYANTLGLELVAGRFFDLDRPTDLSEGLVLNEKAVSQFGWQSSEEALGKKIVSPSTTPQGTVIGVVKDYHQLGLQNKIHGIAIDFAPDYGHFLAIRFDPTQTSKVLSEVRSIWADAFLEYPLNYFFLNEDFGRLYGNESRLSKMFGLFAGLTLLISLIGLMGLVAYLLANKTKELSVRKILGAATVDLIALVTKEFMVLVAVSLLLALPLVWYFGATWLKNFAYRTDLQVSAFIGSALLAFLVTFVAVGLQAYKAIRSNTLAALKSE